MSKKVFISYSHQDKAVVEGLAADLNSNGVDVFFDQWDIQPGDSIVDKIFTQGLAEAQLFVVVLSKASVSSRWVREELDAATIRRIEGITKVVPVIIED